MITMEVFYFVSFDGGFVQTAQVEASSKEKAIAILFDECPKFWASVTKSEYLSLIE